MNPASTSSSQVATETSSTKGQHPDAWHEIVMSAHPEIAKAGSEANLAFITAYNDAIANQGLGNFDPLKLADATMMAIYEKRDPSIVRLRRLCPDLYSVQLWWFQVIGKYPNVGTPEHPESNAFLAAYFNAGQVPETAMAIADKLYAEWNAWADRELFRQARERELRPGVRRSRAPKKPRTPRWRHLRAAQLQAAQSPYLSVRNP